MLCEIVPKLRRIMVMSIKCQKCGKELRTSSGGLISGFGQAFVDEMSETDPCICKSCGFVSCDRCCYDKESRKFICPKCKKSLSTGR